MNGLFYCKTHYKDVLPVVKITKGNKTEGSPSTPTETPKEEPFTPEATPKTRRPSAFESNKQENSLFKSPKALPPAHTDTPTRAANRRGSVFGISPTALEFAMDTILPVWQSMIQSSNDKTMNDMGLTKGISTEGPNWLLMGYNAQNPKKIEFVASGKGGLEEMKPHLQPDAVMHAIVRVVAKTHNNMFERIVFITWAGPQISVVKRMHANAYRNDFAKFFSTTFHVEMIAHSLEDLASEKVLLQLRKIQQAEYQF